DRLWSDNQTSARWEPGFVYAAAPAPATWRSFRLRGAALYDAWGTEVLVYDTGKGYAALSAGRDQVFRWDIGANGTIETDPNAFGPDETPDQPSPIVGPQGDDEWGGHDNVVVGEQ
nr:hypothetical protein [Planctomycetota bacterium]